MMALVTTKTQFFRKFQLLALTKLVSSKRYVTTRQNVDSDYGVSKTCYLKLCNLMFNKTGVAVATTKKTARPL